MKFICTLCNYIHEEEYGSDNKTAIKDFEHLPDDWHCPGCEGAKEFFQSCSCVTVSPVAAHSKAVHTCKI